MSMCGRKYVVVIICVYVVGIAGRTVQHCCNLEAELRVYLPNI
jgi:hypothetical protein